MTAPVYWLGRAFLVGDWTEGEAFAFARRIEEITAEEQERAERANDRESES